MNQPIVVKVGGSTLGQHDTALEDIAALQQAGNTIIVVHGGGSAATEWLKVHGVESQFIDGLRVTGADAIDVVVAVFAGLVNKQLVAALQALGARAIGLSGADGGLLATTQADARLGYVGEVTGVNSESIDALLAAGFMPVICSVGYWQDEPARLMNVNADTVAGEIAAAVGASNLVFLTDVAHVRDASGNDVSELRAPDVESLIESKVATGGMIPKLRASVRAARAGTCCHIIDGREAHALRAVLEGGGGTTAIGLGTRVTA
jgi:acetylglutamate kinase